MEKSADAFRTISEVAADLGVPQHVLRFWETRFHQIRPLKRAGGRRYYRPGDVVLLRAVRRLLYDEGYTIKGVQRLLTEQGPRALRGEGPDVLPTPPEAARRLADAEGPFGSSDPASEGAMLPAVAGAEREATVPGRDALREALACVDECRSILLAALGSPRS